MRLSTTVTVALVIGTLSALHIRDPLCDVFEGEGCDPSTDRPCCNTDTSLMTCKIAEEGQLDAWEMDVCSVGCSVFGSGDTSCCANDTFNACA